MTATMVLAVFIIGEAPSKIRSHNRLTRTLHFAKTWPRSETNLANNEEVLTLFGRRNGRGRF
jgi:hypothetical protein